MYGNVIVEFNNSYLAILWTTCHKRVYKGKIEIGENYGTFNEEAGIL